MFAHRRTGERVENAVSEEVRGRAEECINVVKYNKTGENGRETWQRRCDVSASRGNVVMAQELCLRRFSWLERARAHQRAMMSVSATPYALTTRRARTASDGKAPVRCDNSVAVSWVSREAKVR